MASSTPQSTSRHPPLPQNDRENEPSFPNAVLEPAAKRQKTGCYGGEASSIDLLPPEILELVLCHLSLKGLLKARLVSKRWNAIVDNEKFMTYKKMYRKLESDSTTQMSVYSSSLYCAVVQSPHPFLEFVRSAGSFRPEIYPGTNVALRRCSQFALAHKILVDKLSGEASIEELNTWSLIFVLIVLSRTVKDCWSVIRQMTVPCLHQYKSVQLMSPVHGFNFLYYIGMFLKALRDPCSLSPGCHYRLFYALYQSERSGKQMLGNLRKVLSSHKGQQSIQRYSTSDSPTRLTQEQVTIINHDMEAGNLLKIVAFAGTGKTTTLVEYTKLRPDIVFLLACYNKSVQLHAQKQFPSNVTCKTFHSLAYQKFGSRYRGKLGDVKAYAVSKILGKFYHLVQSKRLIDTLYNFIASSDDQVKSDHVPDDVRKKEPNKWENYVEDAQQVWECMTDLSNRDARMTHDGYLKMWQLSRPQIEGYDCLLIDEAQDITPAVASALFSQVTPKVLVGDPYQQIYGFKGASNVLSIVPATHTYYLTQSFRFGPEIAYVAACILDVLKGVKNRLIVGTMRESGIWGKTDGQIAVIARLNYTLFNEAVSICTKQPETSIGFVGGIESYGMNRILEVYALYSGHQVKDPFISKFRSFGDLKRYASDAPDPELCGKIKTVENHCNKIPAHISMLRKRSRPESVADTLFTTAHKAKGLEFSTVRLLDDFLGASHGVSTDRVPVGLLPDDEYNLLYVAATRAKKQLVMSKTLYKVLKMAGENFYVLMEKSEEQLGVPCCVICNKDFDGRDDTSAVAIKQQEVVLENGSAVQSDCILRCPDCRERLAPFYSGL